MADEPTGAPKTAAEGIRRTIAGLDDEIKHDEHRAEWHAGHSAQFAESAKAYRKLRASYEDALEALEATPPPTP